MRAQIRPTGSAWLKSGLSEQQQADLFVADLVGSARQWVKSGKGGAGTSMGNRAFWRMTDIAPPLHDLRGVPRDIFGDSSSPPAPDYTATAAATEESARIMAAQGDRVLDESKRQYDTNMAVAKPVADAQLALMQQTKQQGDDYYDYAKTTFRPLEQSMADQANVEGSDARAEEMAGQAAADARRGQSQQANMMMRTGQRYGWSPAKMAAMAGTLAGGNASAVAGATTTARNTQKNLGWARKMDAAGLGRNLPTASQGAYSISNQSGNSAVQNTMAPGAQAQNGSIAAAGIYGQGQQLKMQGNLGILNAQTSYANANANQGSDMGGLGSLMGGAASMYTAFSDRRLKENIIKVGVGPHGLALYEFNYIGEPDHRFRGVMADEVESVMPDAVTYDDLGFASVNYGMLGIEMVEV